MTITFRVDDGFDTFAVPPAIISADQLAGLTTFLRDQSDRLGFALTDPEYGEIGDPSFSFDIRICPLAIASVAAIFDHDTAVITVVDEAQFRGRRGRIWREESTGVLRFELSGNPDAAPGLEVATGNAYAILETLGLEPESCGEIPLSELRSRLADPAICRRFDADPHLSRYLPSLIAMTQVSPIAADPRIAWY